MRLTVAKSFGLKSISVSVRLQVSDDFGWIVDVFLFWWTTDGDEKPGVSNVVGLEYYIMVVKSTACYCCLY